MRIAEQSRRWLETALLTNGLALDLGAMRVLLHSDVPDLIPGLERNYRDYPTSNSEGFFDIHMRLVRVNGLRRHLHPQFRFVVDGCNLFEPLPLRQAIAQFEWALNWVIAHRANHFLLLHAGVVERDGQVVILPAIPGSGKSTLTAALVARGFRLFSDEFGMVHRGDGKVQAMVRPISLKNESIEVIGRFAARDRIGPAVADTHKGTVAHVAPDRHSVDQCRIPGRATLILFPRFEALAPVEVEPLHRAQAFTKLAANSFNYQVLGPDGFLAMDRLIRACACYRMRYGDLDQAIARIDDLLRDASAQP